MHFYVLGVIAETHRSELLYDAAGQTELLRAAIPGAADDLRYENAMPLVAGASLAVAFSADSTPSSQANIAALVDGTDRPAGCQMIVKAELAGRVGLSFIGTPGVDSQIPGPVGNTVAGTGSFRHTFFAMKNAQGALLDTRNLTSREPTARTLIVGALPGGQAPGGVIHSVTLTPFLDVP